MLLRLSKEQVLQKKKCWTFRSAGGKLFVFLVVLASQEFLTAELLLRHTAEPSPSSAADWGSFRNNKNKGSFRNNKNKGTLLPAVSNPQPQNQPPVVLVRKKDYIMQTGKRNRDYNAAPVVMESHKLIFFTIRKNGCTVWKQLFRRMMGYRDYLTKDPAGFKTNGLVYLYDYNLTHATHLMNSPDYTRAIFLRDPKERFVSAFLDKAVATTYFDNRCCLKILKKKGVKVSTCRNQSKTFPGFCQLTKQCHDSHWGPQSKRMDAKYYSLLNFVGHLETAASDAKRLLQKIGAWEKYGKSGWGKYRNESIFASTSAVKHKTGSGTNASRQRLPRYYTPELETDIEQRFAQDYRVPQFDLQRTKIQYSTSASLP